MSEFIAANCVKKKPPHSHVYNTRRTGTRCSCLNTTCCDTEAFTSDYQVGVGEEVLSLHQRSGVAGVEKVKDPVCVDAHRPVHCRGKTLRISLKTVKIQKQINIFIVSPLFSLLFHHSDLSRSNLIHESILSYGVIKIFFPP